MKCVLVHLFMSTFAESDRQYPLIVGLFLQHMERIVSFFFLLLLFFCFFCCFFLFVFLFLFSLLLLFLLVFLFVCCLLFSCFSKHHDIFFSRLYSQINLMWD